MIKNNRKTKDMDSADPQNRFVWRGCLRGRLVKKPNPQYRKTGSKTDLMMMMMKIKIAKHQLRDELQKTTSSLIFIKMFGSFLSNQMTINETIFETIHSSACIIFFFCNTIRDH